MSIRNRVQYTFDNIERRWTRYAVSPPRRSTLDKARKQSISMSEARKQSLSLDQDIKNRIDCQTKAGFHEMMEADNRSPCVYVG